MKLLRWLRLTWDDVEFAIVYALLHRRPK